MKNNIDNLIQRTRQYWYQDGLVEITVGLFFMVLSPYFLAQAWIKTVPLNPVLANIGLLAAILVVIGLFRTALLAVKAHLTYPRTGYVAYPRLHKGSLWQRYGLATWLILVCIALLALTLASRTPPAWAPFLLGVVAGLAVLFVSYRFRLLRFTLLACALTLIGAVISIYNPGEADAATLSAAADGVCFLLSGALTLVRYLRNTRPPTEGEL